MRTKYDIQHRIWQMVLTNISGQGFITFTLDELKGVPQDDISQFTKRTGNGKEVYDVALKPYDIFPVVIFPSYLCPFRCSPPA